MIDDNSRTGVYVFGGHLGDPQKSGFKQYIQESKYVCVFPFLGPCMYTSSKDDFLYKSQCSMWPRFFFFQTEISELHEVEWTMTHIVRASWNSSLAREAGGAILGQERDEFFWQFCGDLWPKCNKCSYTVNVCVSVWLEYMYSYNYADTWPFNS